MGQDHPTHPTSSGEPRSDVRIEALAASVASLGRGLVQIGARTARVQQLLEARDLASDPGLLRAHLDLLDAVSAAVEALGAHDAADGLRLAVARAEESLAAAGLTPVRPPPGATFDPETMRAVGEAPPAAAHAVAHTVRSGWARDGEPAQIIRPAWVRVVAVRS